MLLIQCDGCHTSAFADCTCPDGWDAVANGHVTTEVAQVASAASGVPVQPCLFTSLDALVKCPPGSGCCQLDHDHAQPCAGGHTEPCPEPPGKCKAWASETANQLHPLVNTDPGPCPGGHCHKDLPGCTGCRALTITVVPGSTSVQLVPQLRS